MELAIITLAGISSRFNEGESIPVLKGIYYEGTNPENTLLYRLIDSLDSCEKIILVGGYLFDSLKEYVGDTLAQYISKIELVYNEHYADFGSGYSFWLGVEAARKYSPDSICFAEGDLYFDPPELSAFCRAKGDAAGINLQPVYSDRAVAAYISMENKLRYAYDVQHGSIFIKEPFRALFNSAQIWKFGQPGRLFERAGLLSEQGRQGTNLILIQDYFDAVTTKQIRIVPFRTWINCNTRMDYKAAFAMARSAAQIKERG